MNTKRYYQKQEYGGKMGEMCIFPKRNRVAGFQDIETGRKTTGGKIRFDKKPTKSHKHFRTTVILWINQSVYEIRPELVISKFALTTTSRKEISVPMERRAYEGV